MRKFGWRFPLISVVGISGSALIMFSAAVDAATTVSGGVGSPLSVEMLAGLWGGVHERRGLPFSAARHLGWSF